MVGLHGAWGCPDIPLVSMKEVDTMYVVCVCTLAYSPSSETHLMCLMVA